MTRFEEIMSGITRKDNNKKKDVDLGVPGLTSEQDNGNPAIDFATEDSDMDIISQLYTKSRNIPNRGEGSSYWDSD